MPQMRIAARATRLRTAHAMACVGVLRNVLAVGGSIKARPSCARIKLCLRSKKQCATADAVIRSVVVLVPVLAGKSALRAAAARNLILLGSKLLLPLRDALADLVVLNEFFGHVGSPSIG